MSRYIFEFLSDNPEWDYFGLEEGLHVFKIHVSPMRMSTPAINKGVYMRTQSSRNHFKIKKATRIPGPPSDPPLQPYTVWCEKI